MTNIIFKNNHFYQILMSYESWMESPKYAEFNFDESGNLDYYDFSKLDELIERLISNYSTTKYDSETGEYSVSFSMGIINKYHLSEIENEYVRNYLENKNIKIIQNMHNPIQFSGENVNYNFKELIRLYKETKDEKYFESFIKSKLKLIQYILYNKYYFQYLKLFNISNDEITIHCIYVLYIKIFDRDYDFENLSNIFIYKVISYAIDSYVMSHSLKSNFIPFISTFIKLKLNNLDDILNNRDLIINQLVQDYADGDNSEIKRKCFENLFDIHFTKNIIDDNNSYEFNENKIWSNEFLYRKLEHLSESDRFVLTYYYGLNGNYPHTYSEIKELLYSNGYTNTPYLSNQAVDSRIKHAEDKLRIRYGLDSYYYNNVRYYSRRK